MYKDGYASDLIGLYSSYEFFQVLSEFTSVLLDKSDVQTSARTFAKYSNLSGVTRSTLPKFAIFSAHSANIGAALTVLAETPVSTPPPGSMILFNYYSCEGDGCKSPVQVVVLYVPHYRVNPDDQQFLLNVPADEFQTFISDTFEGVLELAGAPSMTEICKSTYAPTTPGAYNDPLVFRKKMYAAHGFNARCEHFADCSGAVNLLTLSLTTLSLFAAFLF